MRYRVFHLVAMLAGTIIVVLVAQGSGGCNSSDGEALSDDSVEDAASPPRRDAAKQRDVGPPPPPPVVPEGWELFTEYDPECGFYIPTDRKYLPPPLVWGACSKITSDVALPEPSSMICQHAVIKRYGGPASIGIVSTYALEHGRIMMAFGQAVSNYAGMQIIAEIDGPVRNAILRAGRCGFISSDAPNNGKYMHRVVDHPKERDNSGGAFGGDIDELHPRVYFPKGYYPNKPRAHSFAVGKTLFVETSDITRIYSFDSGRHVADIVNSPDDYDVYYSDYRFHNDDIFWVANTSARSIVKVWTTASGIQTLVGYPRGAQRDASSFGTDGTNMVWLEGIGRSPSAPFGMYDRYEIWTAPYSTDRSKVDATKRRLRSERPGSWGDKYTVGCGYAANVIRPNPDTRVGFRLTRLADGVSWEVITASEDEATSLYIGRPMGITCDEVFADAWFQHRGEIIRIRIDSLGPGIPAD